MNKETSIKLAKDGKLVDTLMNDKDFVDGYKSILKEENGDISDSEMRNVLKTVEKVVSGKTKIENDEDLSRIIRLGLADRGRHMAIAARHFLKSRRSHERCTDSIITLYRKVIAK